MFILPSFVNYPLRLVWEIDMLVRSIFSPSFSFSLRVWQKFREASESFDRERGRADGRNAASKS